MEELLKSILEAINKTVETLQGLSQTIKEQNDKLTLVVDSLNGTIEVETDIPDASGNPTTTKQKVSLLDIVNEIADNIDIATQKVDYLVEASINFQREAADTLKQSTPPR